MGGNLYRNSVKDYLFSLARWQITSIEKLKASAKAIPSHIDCCFTKERIIITKQNKLTITVNAFFSLKYFFITVEFYTLPFCKNKIDKVPAKPLIDKKL